MQKRLWQFQGRNYRPRRPCHAGGALTRGPKQAARKYFIHCKTLSISGVYGFALFDEFVGIEQCTF